MSEVCFLPWAGISQKLSIGHVNVVPWKDVRSRVSTADQKYLDTYFKRHLNYDGQPIQHIALLFVGDNPIKQLSEEECRVIRRAVDALIFAAVTTSLKRIVESGNMTGGFPNSERFQLVFQRFNYSDEFVANRSGGTLHIREKESYHCYAPSDAGSSCYLPNEELLMALGKLLTRPRQAHKKDRIYRALEWFRFAHSGNDQISDLSRVVMMATAFEILLEIGPGSQKRKEMTEKLDTLTRLDNLKKKTIKFGKKPKQKQKVNVVAAWINIFYNLRNKIVHGDKIKPRQLECPVPNVSCLTQLHVAALVVWESMSWELFSDRLLGHEDRTYAKSISRLCGEKHPKETFVRKAFAVRFGLNEYHTKMCWTKTSQSP
ncbi:hypothetical protein [Nitrospira sp. M1]